MSYQFIDKIINTILPQPQGYRLIIKVKYWKQHYMTSKEIESWIINQIIFYYKISSWNGRKFNIMTVLFIFVVLQFICIDHSLIRHYIINDHFNSNICLIILWGYSILIYHQTEHNINNLYCVIALFFIVTYVASFFGTSKIW